MYTVLPKWTGCFNVVEYDHQNHNVILVCSDFLAHSKIREIFHTKRLKPLTTNDYVDFTDSKRNRPGSVEEDRWDVGNDLKFRSQTSTGKPQYKFQSNAWHTNYNQCLSLSDIAEDLIQHFWLYGSKMATFELRMTNKAIRNRRSRQWTFDMINEQRTRAVRGIVYEEKWESQQAVEWISSSFL